MTKWSVFRQIFFVVMSLDAMDKNHRHRLTHKWCNAEFEKTSGHPWIEWILNIHQQKPFSKWNILALEMANSFGIIMMSKSLYAKIHLLHSYFRNLIGLFVSCLFVGFLMMFSLMPSCLKIQYPLDTTHTKDDSDSVARQTIVQQAKEPFILDW